MAAMAARNGRMHRSMSAQEVWNQMGCFFYNRFLRQLPNPIGKMRSTTVETAPGEAVCVHACACMCMCMHACARVCMHVHVCACMCTRVHASAGTRLCSPDRHA
uniref:Uncharacterized protein n=1 Tax=Chlamydomonas euryale TaxID=1486919 RepID=A0A7R9YVD9_9CHLO